VVAYDLRLDFSLAELEDLLVIEFIPVVLVLR